MFSYVTAGSYAAAHMTADECYAVSNEAVELGIIA